MENEPYELRDLIESLRRPQLHGGRPATVHQTHISVVFVGPERAYKLKKPVDYGFVDYSTPERRRSFCEAEVELNRRLAPGVYCGVRAVVRRGGELVFDAPDAEDAVDWVVEMVRLEEHDNFLAHLHVGTLQTEWVVELGRKLAAFHPTCERGAVGEFGAFSTVARNARENFSQSTGQVGHTVDAAVFDAAREATEEALARLAPLIEGRDEAGHTCATHGDLRLEHVYRVDGDLSVVDCIEFNDAFRFADPVADIAFLVMDLRIRWASELADAFSTAYFARLPGGEELLDFYVAYRSAVRAKVHGIAAQSAEVDETTRARSLAKSRAHWLFTWSTLAPPAQRPALVIVAGLPGTGKSTLARSLGERAGFEVIDSDAVRKDLAGVAATDDMSSEVERGIYTSAWTEKTYTECLRRSMTAVTEGRRVVVSATFRSEGWRERFLRAAHAAGIAGVVLECELPREEAVRRISARSKDASDADVAIYDYVAGAWEAPSSTIVASRTRAVSTLSREGATAEALEVLRGFRLHD